MDLISTVEQRYMRTPDGKVWTKLGKAYSYWSRMLPVFDRVRVLARVRDISEVPPDWRRADGDGVCFVAVPCYLGPSQYLLKAKQIRSIASRTVDRESAVIMHAGTSLSASVGPILRETGRPYGVLVVGDPHDVFAPQAVKHPLRPLLRWWFTREQRLQCAEACAALHVTERTLQRRYPCAGLSMGISDVELSDEALSSSPRKPAAAPSPASLVTVGTLEQLYKAPDVLIDAVSRCITEGLDVTLTMIGDGRHRTELEKRAASCGLQERVRFLGQLPSGSQVLRELDSADLFLLPSYQEGLPRAMIEAMARALPCIGSTVGGIPELLAPEDMVPPGDVKALAGKIREVITDPARMAAMSKRNLEKAGQYREDVLRERRLAFYRYVKDKTEEWVRGN